MSLPDTPEINSFEYEIKDPRRKGGSGRGHNDRLY